MKFLIAFAAVVAVAQAQYLRDFGAVVEGPKTILAGPSGTIHADTGSIVKAPETRAFIAPALSAPLIAPRLITPPIVAPRLIGAPLLAPTLAARSFIGSPLLRSPLLGSNLYGAPLLDNSFYGGYGYGARSFGYGGLLY